MDLRSQLGSWGSQHLPLVAAESHREIGRTEDWRHQMAKQRKGTGKAKSLEIRVNKSGYQQFKDPGTGNWTLTHRRVAEKLVGGTIFAGREVHHIDGDRTNNRPSNLRIVSKEEHRRIHQGKK